MKMNKNQSLYRALPSAWITYTPKNSNYNYAARVTRWNTSPVENINEDLIKRDISRRVKSFAAAQGGEVDSSLREEKAQKKTIKKVLILTFIASFICFLGCVIFAPLIVKILFNSLKN